MRFKFMFASVLSVSAANVVSAGPVIVSSEGEPEVRAAGAIVKPEPATGEVVPTPTLPVASITKGVVSPAESSTLKLIASPAFSTQSGIEVEAEAVEAFKIAELLPVEASDSPKVKATLEAVVIFQFQAMALSPLEMEFPPVAAEMADKAEPVPVPQA